MKFAILETPNNQEFSLVYRPEDFSFDIEPPEHGGEWSILINDLHLEVDHDGRVLYAWGLCPLIAYEETNNFPCDCKLAGLVAVRDKSQIPGVSCRRNEEKRWPIYLNKNEGWVCIGDVGIMDKQLVEFAPGCVAAMRGDEMVALWLRTIDH